MTLRRFECGCVGFPVNDDEAIVIDACDGDGELVWSKRGLSSQTSTPLKEDQIEYYELRIRAAFFKAQKYDALKAALRD